MKTPLTLLDLYGSKSEAEHRIRTDTQARFRILRFLLESHAFSEYAHHNHPVLAPPPPVDLLPCGAEHVIQQHILETIELDESTYEGTDKLLHRILPQQLGWGSAAEVERSAQERVLFWVGDQLMVDRI